jgi:hypothetical protein
LFEFKFCGSRHEKRSFSIINAEINVTPCDGQIYFIQTADGGENWPGRQIHFELLHRIAVAFGNDFDAAIRQILDRAFDLMPCRCAQGEIAEAYALHFASIKTYVDEKMSGQGSWLRPDLSNGRGLV